VVEVAKQGVSDSAAALSAASKEERKTCAFLSSTALVWEDRIEQLQASCAIEQTVAKRY
jgi:hypothetical protein